MRRIPLLRSVLILGVAAAVPACGGGGGGGGGVPGASTILVSSTAAGVQGDRTSSQSSISDDGRYVAFTSSSSNLVPPDVGGAGQTDIYRKDLSDGSIIRVSRTPNPANAEPNASSSRPAISADGRYIAFTSFASNLVAAGVAGTTQSNIFLYDVQADTTRIISHIEGNTALEATGNSDLPCITVVGTDVYVAFESAAQNLITGLTGYGASQTHIYRKKIAVAEAMELVSRDVTTATTVGNNSSTRPSISADGTRVAFHSFATNLVATDTNGAVGDVFARNMGGGTTLVSQTDAEVAINAVSFNATISGNGLHVVFRSLGTNLGDTGLVQNDIYIRTNWEAVAATAGTTQISEDPMGTGTGNSCDDPVITFDGNIVVWTSDSNELVNGDANTQRDVFRRDRSGNAIDIVSLTNSGAQMTGGGAQAGSKPAVTASGSYVSFDSAATNLVSPGTTGRQVFRRG
jgi:Tol biopolymer transport system component